jgi:hypothetical protein
LIFQIYGLLYFEYAFRWFYFVVVVYKGLLWQVNVRSAHSVKTCLGALRFATVIAGVRVRMTDWISAGQQLTEVCGATQFNQSSSTLLSGDTGLSLNSGNV